MSTTYLITGANRGIGQALTAVYLTRPSSVVVAAVRDPSSASSKALANLPKDASSKLIVVKIDSASTTDAAEAVATLQTEHGITSLDVVIANAGISKLYPPVHEALATDMLEHYTVNVIGPVYLFRAVRPLLLAAAAEKENGQKSSTPMFIAMGSMAGSIGGAELAPVPNAVYGPSKAALNLIAKKIHMENPEIIAFPIHPGFVQTEMGNTAAQKFGLDKAFETIEQSIEGLLKVFDNATREETSGKFWLYDGKEAPW